MTTSGETLDRAAKAKALLENPTYQEAWEITRQAFIKALEDTPISQPEAAEKLRICLKLLQRVRAHFEIAVQNGKLEQIKLEQQQKRAQRTRAGQPNDFYR